MHGHRASARASRCRRARGSPSTSAVAVSRSRSSTTDASPGPIRSRSGAARLWRTMVARRSDDPVRAPGAPRARGGAADARRWRRAARRATSVCVIAGGTAGAVCRLFAARRWPEPPTSLNQFEVRRRALQRRRPDAVHLTLRGATRAARHRRTARRPAAAGAVVLSRRRSARSARQRRSTASGACARAWCCGLDAPIPHVTRASCVTRRSTGSRPVAAPTTGTRRPSGDTRETALRRDALGPRPRPGGARAAGGRGPPPRHRHADLGRQAPQARRLHRGACGPAWVLARRGRADGLPRAVPARAPPPRASYPAYAALTASDRRRAGSSWASCASRMRSARGGSDDVTSIRIDAAADELVDPDRGREPGRARSTTRTSRRPLLARTLGSPVRFAYVRPAVPHDRCGVGDLAGVGSPAMIRVRVFRDGVADCRTRRASSGRAIAWRTKDAFVWLDVSEPERGGHRRARARCSACTR